MRWLAPLDSASGAVEGKLSRLHQARDQRKRRLENRMPRGRSRHRIAFALSFGHAHQREPLALFSKVASRHRAPPCPSRLLLKRFPPSPSAISVNKPHKEPCARQNQKLKGSL